MGTIDQLSTWAIDHAEAGRAIVPVTPHAKRPPLFRQWETHASTDADRIAAFWQRHPHSNIGIACGPSRLLVIDCDTSTADEADGVDGVEQLAGLAADRDVAVPDTYTVATPSGGVHFYFRQPAGVRLRNTTGQLADRVDTRAAGGYVVAAGSITPGGGYELTDDTPPVELPGWLVQALSERPAVDHSAAHEAPVRQHGRYADVGLRRECDRVRNAARHRHNAVLANAAYNVGQLVGGDYLNHTDAAGALADAAQHMATAECGCTHTEITRVIAAGLTAGANRPRRRRRQRRAA